MRGPTVADARARVRVRPKFSVLSNSLAAILLLTSPIFGVMYWFAIPRRGVELVVIAHAIVVTIGLALLWRQLRVHSEATGTELIGNGIFSPVVRVPYERIARVLFVPTYVGAAPDPVTQLLVVDAEGKRLFRMRGSFWHAEDLVRLAAAVPAPLEVVPDPIPISDFYRTYPRSAYWFEDRRWLQITLVTAAVLAGFALTTFVMVELGLPVRFL
ncbi:hypothetical protein [Homoserinibacter sp. GY 40078]|uniref:hypothetical protein n=1 Tax=Homoserinibacter sp. GY 40078 TaxID=2603275 RepID=UPI0011C9C9E3|nr:hypothetical protein [Homoserinibacter sp. GY 40078]TXK18486.1 hypothetical protein FVQ89_00540 [Homoserinibacter sp. GY 40078]